MLNIYQRINEIKKAIAYIKKDVTVERYKAVTHDKVTAHTRALFIEHGVAVIPDEKSSATVITDMTTGSGIHYVRFEATFNVRFVNIDDPQDILGVTVTAHALDYGDKAPGKALSYATKYAILKALQLETGEDDESRAPASFGGAEDVVPAEPPTRALDAASLGVEAFRAYYKDLTQKDRAALRPHISELQAIAEGAQVSA